MSMDIHDIAESLQYSTLCVSDLDRIRQAMHDAYGDRVEAEAMAGLFKYLFKQNGLDDLYDLDTITVVDRGQGWWGVTFPKEKSVSP